MSSTQSRLNQSSPFAGAHPVYSQNSRSLDHWHAGPIAVTNLSRYRSNASMQPANTITVGSVRAIIGSRFAKRRCTDLRPRSHYRRNSHRHSERRPNHFLGAPGPADVLLRFLDRNGKIVFARVVTRRGARWAPGNPIPTNLAPDLHMVQNPELHATLR